MKKIICGLIVGGIVVIGAQSFAYEKTGDNVDALNQIGEILEKTYSKQKSIDIRLKSMEDKLNKMQDELEWINSNTR